MEDVWIDGRGRDRNKKEEGGRGNGLKEEGYKKINRIGRR